VNLTIFSIYHILYKINLYCQTTKAMKTKRLLLISTISIATMLVWELPAEAQNRPHKMFTEFRLPAAMRLRMVSVLPTAGYQAGNKRLAWRDSHNS
jgi:hypothetical protein